ncbi:hypothetical protein [Roseibium sp.]|uniref:hypothetical protein n=1 Tax=Roseibium sp. TaxID=1936156 RepID=UPI0032648995
MAEFALTPMSATIMFVLACFAGYRYRRVWAAEGPRWKLWFYGVLAAVCLSLVAFVPLTAGA